MNKGRSFFALERRSITSKPSICVISFRIGSKGLKAGFAGCDLELGRLVVGPLEFAEGLSQKVEAFCQGGNKRFLCRQPYTAFF